MHVCAMKRCLRVSAHVTRQHLANSWCARCENMRAPTWIEAVQGACASHAAGCVLRLLHAAAPTTPPAMPLTSLGLLYMRATAATMARWKPSGSGCFFESQREERATN